MNPFGLDEMLQRYKPGQLGAGAVLGNPAGMQQAQEENLAALMEAYKRAQEQQQRGVGMMQPEYIQNSGALGALAMIAQAYAGKKLEKRAGETASDYASRIFEEQRKQEAAAAAAAEAAERAKWERTVAREDTVLSSKQKHSAELAQRRIDEANRRAELSANARIQAAKISASGQGAAKPPAGYRFSADGESLEPIKGSPAYNKQKDREAAETKKMAAVGMQGDLVLDMIGRAKEQAGQFGTTGMTGRVLRNVGGSSAHDLSKTLETVKANIGFDKLQQMREMSPTGGALGQVAVQELTALQSTLGSLEQAQSREQLMENLDAVEKHYKNWLGVMSEAADNDPAGIFK